MTALEVVLKHYKGLVRFASMMGIEYPQDTVQGAVVAVLTEGLYQPSEEEKKRVQQLLTRIRWIILNEVNSYEAKNVVSLYEVRKEEGQNESSIQLALDVKQACQDLSGEDLELLYLHFIKGLTQEEVSDVLALDQSNISRRIGKLRKLMQKKLKDYKHLKV